MASSNIPVNVTSPTATTSTMTTTPTMFSPTVQLPSDITGFPNLPSTPGTSYSYRSTRYYKSTTTVRTTRQGPFLHPTPTASVDRLFFDTCQNTKIRDFIGPPIDIIVVNASDSITDAFYTLVDNDIVSAPVYDSITNQYVTFLSILDIISYLVEIYQFQVESADPMIEELVLQERFKGTPVSALGIGNWRNPWYTISQEMSILEAINMFSRTRADDIAVFDSNGNFVNILTQHMLVQWIAQRPFEEIGQLSSKSIQTLRLGFQRVVRVNKRRSLLRAFMRMHDVNVSGVAVVDDFNTVVGNISSTDLKDLGKGVINFRKLYMTCESFLNQKQQGKNLPQLLYVHRSQSVGDVLDLFFRYKIHRVYVVEKDSFAPVGVISDGDIINLFANALPASSTAGTSGTSRA